MTTMGLGSAFARVFADLGHPAIRLALWITLALTVGFFAGLLQVVEFGLSTVQVVDVGWIQSLFGWFIGVFGGFPTLALSWILFPPVATFSLGPCWRTSLLNWKRRTIPAGSRGTILA